MYFIPSYCVRCAHFFCKSFLISAPLYYIGIGLPTNLNQVSAPFCGGLNPEPNVHVCVCSGYSVISAAAVAAPLRVAAVRTAGRAAARSVLLLPLLSVAAVAFAVRLLLLLLLRTVLPVVAGRRTVGGSRAADRLAVAGGGGVRTGRRMGRVLGGGGLLCRRQLTGMGREYREF